MNDSAGTDSMIASVFAPIYALLSILYGMVVSLRNFLFDSGIFHEYRCSLPVICVGNITVGGTGKTPFVRALVEVLRARGETPVVISRGYGGSRRGPTLVREGDSAAEIGDEPRMLAAECPVVIARSRVLGAQFVERESLGTVIILDDGYQHRWLARSLNIVCINVADEKACTDFIAGRVLPSGIFREPRAQGLARASAVVLSARRPVSTLLDSPAVRAVVEALPPQLPRLMARLRDHTVASVSGRVQLLPQPVIAICAIANPQGFFATLQSSHFAIVEKIALADHSRRVGEVVEAFLEDSKYPIVLTEKDAVKLPETLRANPRVNVLKFTLAIEPRETLEALLNRLPMHRVQ